MPELMTSQAGTESTESVNQLGSSLLLALQSIRTAYEGIEEAIELREEAIRSADVNGLVRGLKVENNLVQHVAEEEKRRIALVASFVDLFGEPPRLGGTVSWIADRVGGDLGEDLRIAGDDLRKTLERVGKRNATSKAAVESLATHMEGLLRSATAQLSHTGAYGRRGAIEAGPTVVSAIDLTT